MTPEERRAINEAAFPRLKPTIDSDYPPKQFVAIAGGKIVADDADLDTLIAKLAALGIDPLDALVDRSGEVVPEYFEFLGIALSIEPL